MSHLTKEQGYIIGVMIVRKFPQKVITETIGKCKKIKAVEDLI
jgi:hypothetical protein